MARNNALSKGKRFEDMVAKLFIEKGFRVERNKVVRIGKERVEIDIIVKGMEEECLIECKYRESNVKLKEVAKYVSILELMNYDLGNALMVTNKGYTTRARKLAEKKGLVLYTLNELKKVMGV